MNKSKITKINIQKQQQIPVPPILNNLSNNLSTNLSTNLTNNLSNNLTTNLRPTNHPMTSKDDNLEFEHYSFTTPLNTIKLEKCKDLNSLNSSTNYSITDLTNNKLNAANKTNKERKKCFLNRPNKECRDNTNDTNDKSASEFHSFASYTEQCKLSNQNNCIDNSLASNISSDSLSINQDVVLNEVSNKRIKRNKMILNRKKVLNKSKNSLPSSMLIPVIYPKMTVLCPHQKYLIKNQELLDENEEEEDNKFKLSNRCEFLLFCISSSINLSNTWRFPYMVYKFNGGTFLVPYLVCSIVVGFPLLLIELTLAQFSKMNSVHLFKNLVPIFKGLSHITVLTSFTTAIYMNLIISWILIYLFESSFYGLRWKKCDPLYSNPNCTNLESIKYGMINRSSLVVSSEDFFNTQFLKSLSTEDQLTKINWTVFFALLAAWSILFVFQSLNVKNSGKIVYFVATFPYLILFLLFLKCITLNGTDGLIFFMIPNLNKLKDIELWKDAMIQTILSFGLTGPITTYASKNRFYNRVISYSILIWSVNILTSLFVCFITFSIIGYFSSILRRPVHLTLSSGIGFLFIVIPDRLALMQWPVLWSSFYFLILFIIGLNTQLTSLEIISTFVNDLMKNKTRSKKFLNNLALFMLFFFLSLPFTMRSGAYLLEITDYYLNGLVLLCLAFMEFFIVSYIFGISNFFNLLKTMKCFYPKLLLKSHLTVLLTTICPIILAYLINVNFVQILNMKERSLFKSSEKLSDLFCHSVWLFLIFNLFLIFYGCFHYIFMQKLEPKFRTNQIWIKIRFGFEASSDFKLNSSLNTLKTTRKPKYLGAMSKKHQSNCNLHFKNNKMFKSKDSIIIF